MVVISHDCDLANDDLEVEPEVEVIVGRTVATTNGNFAWGKAPRTLHLVAHQNGTPVNIELANTRKRVLLKSALAQFEPDSAFALDGPALSTVRSWLASRYNRAAFPDAFVRRMRETKAESKLAGVLKDSGALISFVYFDLDKGACVEREDGDPYQLSIVLVFQSGVDPEKAADDADFIADSVREAVEARLRDRSSITLESCLAISEDDITVSKARVLTQWRLEHMTLQAESDQPGPFAP